MIPSTNSSEDTASDMDGHSYLGPLYTQPVCSQISNLLNSDSADFLKAFLGRKSRFHGLRMWKFGDWKQNSCCMKRPFVTHTP